MKRFILFLLVAATAAAQTAKTRVDLYAQIGTQLASGQQLTAAQLRTVINDVVASAYNAQTDGVPATPASVAAAQAAAISTASADATTKATAAQANAVQRANHTGTQLASTISDFTSAAQSANSAALALKAPLASPGFTGVPTAPTATGGTNTTQIATTAYVQAAVSNAGGGNVTGPTGGGTSRHVVVYADNTGLILADSPVSIDASGNVTGVLGLTVGTLTVTNFQFTNLTGVIPAANGGAGAINGLLKANGSGVVSQAGSGTDYEIPLTFSGALNRSGTTITVGAGTVTNAMLAGSIDLASKVTGVLPAANGGAGSVNGLLRANGSGGVSQAAANTDYVAPGGNLGAGTATTAAARDNSTKVATTAYTDRAAIIGKGSADLGNLTGTVNIDWSQGQTFRGVLTGNTTFTFSNAVDGQTIVVDVAQTGTNTYTVTWPSMKWPAGTAPTMTTGAATSDITTIVDVNGTFKGVSAQNVK